MVASIGKIISPTPDVTHYKRNGYYARDYPARQAANASAGGQEMMAVNFRRDTSRNPGLDCIPIASSRMRSETAMATQPQM